MGWDTTLPAQPSSRAGGKSEARGLSHQFPLKKEPGGFPAKNNRNKLILHAESVFAGGQRLHQNSGVAALFYMARDEILPSL